MKLRLYNSLTHAEEMFSPKGKTVRLYTCGPTVYRRAHIGNFRSFLMEDVLKRVLLFDGHDVRHVMNITDVGHLTSDADAGEDRMEAEARRTNTSARDISDAITAAFFDDCKRLNLLAADEYPRATRHIKEQIDLIATLEHKKYTYRTSDGIYFDTSKFPEYGKLSTLDRGMQEGARVEKNDEKRSPADFALWKFSPKDAQRQMEWDSPWGVGFPGWHLECSAMAMKYLGPTLDIHCGGIDHLSIHHPNEMAQSEAATGKPFSRFWMHVAFLQLKDEKMGKSLGNTFTLDDLAAKGFEPLALRYLCLLTHYRKPMTFTWDALTAAQNALRSLRAAIAPWKAGKKTLPEFMKRFSDMVNDDLNVSGALAVAWDVLKADAPESAKRATIERFDEVLGLDLQSAQPGAVPEAVQELVRQRSAARKKKDFAKADELRAAIEKAGFVVNDTAKGSTVTKR